MYYHEIVLTPTPFPDFTISQAMFGAAEWSFNMPTGILGAAMGQGYNQDYPSFIDNMYNEGLIQDKDFSVALGSVNEDEGNLLLTTEAQVHGLR